MTRNECLVARRLPMQPATHPLIDVFSVLSQPEQSLGALLQRQCPDRVANLASTTADLASPQTS
jgi:hypothetical protein